MTDVVGLGEAMVLLEPHDGGSLRTATTLVPRVAGSEFNTCAAIARCGLRAAFCSRFGEDPLGRLVLDAAANLGIDVRLVAREIDGRTGVFFREALPDGLRRVYYYRAGSAASMMNTVDGERAIRCRPRALVVSGITLALGPGPTAAALAAVRAARKVGSLVVADPNLRAPLGGLAAVEEPLRALIASSDLLLAGLGEAQVLFGEKDPEDLVAAAHLAGCPEVVLKDGGRGCWFEQDRRVIHLPAFSVRAVDPVGAGDAFGGGYLAARLSGKSAFHAARLGAWFGAQVAASPGDTEGLPSTQEAKQLLDAPPSVADASACKRLPADGPDPTGRIVG
jgi:2-dehydro-3-deoxygluconokinase